MPTLARIPNKREFLARRLRDLGLLRLIERLGRRPGLLVLCYHRVGDPSVEPYYGPLISATPEAFRAQLRLVRDRFQVASLDDLIGPLGAGEFRATEPTALITFDDGYRDNVDLALPILQELGLPAAFFLTTDFVGEGRLPWWDRVAFAVTQSPLSRLTLDRPEPLTLDLPPDRRDAPLGSVIAAYLRADHPEDPALLAHLEERAEAAPPEGAGRRLFLGWEDARRLASSGMTLGAHTVTHRRLSRLSEPEQSDELARSKAILEHELGHPVLALAYPYGDPAAFDASTTRLALEAGYRAAFALRPGLVRPGRVDPFDLPRFHVTAADSPVLLRARLALASAFGASRL